MLQPGHEVDRYQIERLVGEGGFALVYLVRHVTLGTEHALKVLKLSSPDFHERLLHEGRVQAKLSHPNILAVRDVIDVEGAPGLILDLVTGGSLEQLLAGRHPGLEDVDDLGRGILDGVRVAHAMGLVHRDLKPANVLLDVTPYGVIPKVADFGLARLLFPGLTGGGAGTTRSNVLMGTPNYMAPEQIEDSAAADARSDLFSLGAILYELVSGRRAFSGDKVADVLYHVANLRYQPLAEVAPRAPERMINAVEAALTLDPAERVPSADDLLALWLGTTKAVVRRQSSGTQSRRLGIGTLLKTSIDSGPTIIPDRARSSGRPAWWVPGLLLVAVIAMGLGTALVTVVYHQRTTARAALVDDLVPVEVQGPPPPVPEVVVVPLSDDEREAVAEPPPRPAVEPPPRPVPPAPQVDEAADAVAAVVETAPEPLPRVPGGGEPADDGARGVASVEVAGDGVERAVLVSRNDGSQVPTGDAVPAGLYDLLVWFTDEDAVPIALGLRVQGDDALAVVCDAAFYTCRTTP